MWVFCFLFHRSCFLYYIHSKTPILCSYFLGQEENAESEGCTSESGNPVQNDAGVEEVSVGDPAESSASHSEGRSKRDAAEMILEEPSVGEELEKSPVETAPKEPSGGNENTSNVSSSSASSDVVSGTPQPASRRQSFITLEKFSSLENRPFSLSPLNSLSEMSASASAADKQESTNVCRTGATPEKSGENKKPLKSEPEQIFSAIRRLTRRQSKMEHQGKKPSKPFLRSEQEKSSQEAFVSGSVENSPELSSAAEDMEHVLLPQSQAPHSTEGDTKKETEEVQALDTDSKENTPPETTVSADQVAGDDSPVPHVSPNPKILRRSSRRRAETVESTTGSQDKEDDHQKRRKEDEKSGQKKVQQAKEDGSQKQKAVSGKTAENTNEKERDLPESTAAEELGSKESPASRGLDEEANRSARSGDNLKADMEGQDCTSKTGGQKKVERPRYHTRRASQGLLASIENSEADGSETKEESTRKKRSAKVKNRGDCPEGKRKDLQPGSHSHEVSSQGGETKNLLETNQGELSCEVGTDAAVTAEVSDPKPQVTPTGTSQTLGPASSETSPHAQNVNVEEKSDTLMESFTSPSVSDQDLQAAEENKCVEKQVKLEDSCPAVLPEKVPVANTSGGDLSSLQTPECQHKRSKRVKKPKNCDCCFKKSKQEVASLTESKLESAHEENEPPATPVQTPVNTPEVSGTSDLESLSMAPCAMSTPLHPPKEPGTCSVEREQLSEDNLQGNSAVVQQDLTNPECTAGETTESVVEMEERADQSEPAEQSLSGAVSEEAGDSLAAGDRSEEPAATEKEEIRQNGQQEETPGALIVISKPETKQMSELESVQDDKEEDVRETCIIEDKEMKEELVETEIMLPENATLDEEDAVENNSVDSPQKPEDHKSSALANESPNSMQARCMWSPSASPSTSILKRGVKRNQDDDSLSPANKVCDTIHSVTLAGRSVCNGGV